MKKKHVSKEQLRRRELVKNEKRCQEFDFDLAYKLLVDITKVFEKKNIPYHLEGGTLLGIVRDKALLPWDHDLDISVPQSAEKSAYRALLPLLLKGWQLSRRRWWRFDLVKVKGSRIIKVRKKDHGWFHSGTVYLDIFVKVNSQGFSYWQAKEKLMRVDAAYYDGFEYVSDGKNQFRAPKNYEGYLTEKYGDWSIPVKEWDCGSDEKTIVE